MANIAYKNKDGESVFDIVNRLKIKTLQKYLVEAANKRKNLKAQPKQQPAAPPRQAPTQVVEPAPVQNPPAPIPAAQNPPPSTSILEGTHKSNPEKVANDARVLLEKSQELKQSLPSPKIKAQANLNEENQRINSILQGQKIKKL